MCICHILKGAPAPMKCQKMSPTINQIDTFSDRGGSGSIMCQILRNVICEWYLSGFNLSSFISTF